MSRMTNPMRRILPVMFVLGLQWAVPPATVRAEQPQPTRAAQDDPSDRSLGFHAVKGASAESVPGGRLLAIGYGALWLLVFAFVLSCVRSQISTRRKLTELEKALTMRPPN
jgi:hypothetical protein